MTRQQETKGNQRSKSAVVVAMEAHAGLEAKLIDLQARIVKEQASIDKLQADADPDDEALVNEISQGVVRLDLLKRKADVLGDDIANASQELKRTVRTAESERTTRMERLLHEIEEWTTKQLAAFYPPQGESPALQQAVNSTLLMGRARGLMGAYLVPEDFETSTEYAQAHMELSKAVGTLAENFSVSNHSSL
jgi:septal ring factor EnvC (AmiA/AmiB activator)